MPERQKLVDECGSKYPAGDVKTQIRQAFHNGGNTFFYRFRCLFFGLNGLIGALRKYGNLNDRNRSVLTLRLTPGTDTWQIMSYLPLDSDN